MAPNIHQRDHRRRTPARSPLACILPPALLRRLAAEADSAEARQAALHALRLDTAFRLARAESAARTIAAAPTTFARVGGTPQIGIYDQQHSTDQTPGVLVRGQEQPPVQDEAVNQAYDGFT